MGNVNVERELHIKCSISNFNTHSMIQKPKFEVSYCVLEERNHPITSFSL